MSEAMCLIMAQVDDVAGELLGEFIRRAEAVGARNVQVLSSITKKGRPGYVIHVDVPSRLEAEIAVLLGAELGTWGYRVVAAEHKHFDIEHHETGLELRVGGATYDFPLRFKTVALAGRFERVKAEHDDLASACAALREDGRELPLTALKAAVESALASTGERSRLTLEL
ncbi:MAG: nickel insertion protein [Gammaproteobacteria bacterium]